MSEVVSADTPVAPVESNGRGAHAFYSRIADLLDDVTVGVQPVTPAEDTLAELFAATAPAQPRDVQAALPPTAPADVVGDLPPVAAPVSLPAAPAAPAETPVVASAPEPGMRDLPPPAAAAVAGAHLAAPVSLPAAPAAPAETPVVASAPEPGMRDLPPPAAIASAAPPEALSPAQPADLAAAALVAAKLVDVQEPDQRLDGASAASDDLSPAAATAAVAGVTFPAWVPPWDESQRPASAPPTLAAAAVSADVPAAPPVAPPAEHSIFAPLPATPAPADLPPFLAVAAVAAAPELPPAGDAPLALAVETVAPVEGEPATGTEEAGSASQPAAPALVSIRGRMDGLAVEIGSDGPWPAVLAALTARLEQAASFFRAAKVALDVGGRALAEDDLSAITTLLDKHGMVLALVRTGAERTFQSALALGLTVTLEAADGAAMAEAAAATANVSTTGYFVYRGYLRSGNRLRRQEHILVIGDVNPGAEVISEGDVLVWGRLRGIVHAGVGGNGRAIVAALDMEPTQLRIADVMTASPDPQPGQPGKWFWQRSANKRPEVARIVHKAIVFEEWDTGRPGGLVSLRRGG